MLFECALFALASTISLPANGYFHQQSSRSYVLSARGRVSLQNINGDVHIRAWDRNEVRIDAVKSAASRNLLNEARVEVESTADAIDIQTRYGDAGATNPGKVEFTVMVPRHARLSEIKLINGALDIEGVSGGVNASSVNGTVRAQKIAGDARLSTVNGRLEASFDRLSGARNITLASVNGPISLSIPYDAAAEFNARNVTGGIDNDFGIPVSQDHAAGSQLHGVIKGGGTFINLKNINGTICIMPVAHGRRVKFT
ncbi:MAG TPA: DUF4097 family beta strand repeat-containing protein [Bryobacteraceae bacterium]|nr:DUF4097 family beta strand repeat-containing protein [Bryobacteraceae bacterium]